MEEERLKDLFSQYDPELSSSMAFLERLERKLEAVELIHQENAAVMKRNKLAVAIATFAGFISGILFTLILPYLADVIKSSMEAIAGHEWQQDFSGYPQVISWFIVGAISVFIAVNTYNISLSLLPLKGGNRED